MTVLARKKEGNRLEAYSPKRELRRLHGWPSGRQWVKLRKAMNKLPAPPVELSSAPRMKGQWEL